MTLTETNTLRAARSPVEFQIWTHYHPPLGRSRKGHNSFYFLSRCGRWHARQGNGDSMILVDRKQDVVHVVKGKMPEVEALAGSIVAGE